MEFFKQALSSAKQLLPMAAALECAAQGSDIDGLMLASGQVREQNKCMMLADVPILHFVSKQT